MSSTIARLFNTQDETITYELLATSKIHNLPAEELYFKWESYLLNTCTSSDKSLNIMNLRNFKLQLQSEAVQNTPVKKPSLNLKKRVQQQSTPLRNSSSPLTPSNYASDSTPKASQSNFVSRKNPGLITNTLNGHLEIAPNNSVFDTRVGLLSAVSLKKYKYRYMFEKLSERSAVLDERIDYFANRVKEFYKGSFEIEIGDPGMMNQVRNLPNNQRDCLTDD